MTCDISIKLKHRFAWVKPRQADSLVVVLISLCITCRTDSVFLNVIFLHVHTENILTQYDMAALHHDHQWEGMSDWLMKLLSIQRWENDPGNPLTYQQGTFIPPPMNMIYEGSQCVAPLTRDRVMKWWANLREHKLLTEEHLLKCTD